MDRKVQRILEDISGLGGELEDLGVRVQELEAATGDAGESLVSFLGFRFTSLVVMGTLLGLVLLLLVVILVLLSLMWCRMRAPHCPPQNVSIIFFLLLFFFLLYLMNVFYITAYASFRKRSLWRQLSVMMQTYPSPRYPILSSQTLKADGL